MNQSALFEASNERPEQRACADPQDRERQEYGHNPHNIAITHTLNPSRFDRNTVRSRDLCLISRIELSQDKIAMFDIQQFSHAANEMFFIVVEVPVGVCDLPHFTDQIDL